MVQAPQQTSAYTSNGSKAAQQPAVQPRPVPSAEPILQPISSSDIFRGVFAPPPMARAAPPPANDDKPESVPHSASPLIDKKQAVSEEELQRRLRGEYEAAHSRLSSVVSGNLDRPLHLRNIRLSPAPPTTRSSFLSSLLKPFLQPLPNWVPTWLDPSPAGPPKTLQEVLHTTRALMAHLDKFGVYDVQRSGVRLQPVRGGDVDEVELVLALRERGRLFLKAGTEVGGGEGGGVSSSTWMLCGNGPEGGIRPKSS